MQLTQMTSPSVSAASTHQQHHFLLWTVAVCPSPMQNNGKSSDSTPYMNGRATALGVFKAYVVFLLIGIVEDKVD